MYDDYDPFETDIFEIVEEDVLWNTNSDDGSALFAKNDEEEDVAPIIDEALETEEGEDLGALGLHIADDEKPEEEEL